MKQESCIGPQVLAWSSNLENVAKLSLKESPKFRGASSCVSSAELCEVRYHSLRLSLLKEDPVSVVNSSLLIHLANRLR